MKVRGSPEKSPSIHQEVYGEQKKAGEIKPLISAPQRLHDCEDTNGQASPAVRRLVLSSALVRASARPLCATISFRTQGKRIASVRYFAICSSTIARCAPSSKVFASTSVRPSSAELIIAVYKIIPTPSRRAKAKVRKASAQASTFLTPRLHNSLPEGGRA